VGVQQEAVGQRALAVVNVGNDAEITDKLNGKICHE
jgi:hypothetical protein